VVFRRAQLGAQAVAMRVDRMTTSLRVLTIALVASPAWVLGAASYTASIEIQRLDPIMALRAYVVRFTGDSPKDCGQHFMETGRVPGVEAGADRLNRSLRCAIEAAKNRTTFWTLKQDFGLDSWNAQGLLGDDKGEMYRFTFDNAPCGGPGCASQFSIRRCVQPIVSTARNGRASFACGRVLQ
jgi:hypothetical protein